MLGRHDHIGGGTPGQVANPLRKTLELPTYGEVRHLTGSCQLIDGNDKFATGLRLVEKPLNKPLVSWKRPSNQTGIYGMRHNRTPAPPF
jgi:hypothetical protein